MARKSVDPMAAMIRQAEKEARVDARRARNKRRLREALLLLIVTVIAAGVGYWWYSHRDEVADQTPPVDCSPPAVSIGCGGVQPAP